MRLNVLKNDFESCGWAAIKPTGESAYRTQPRQYGTLVHLSLVLLKWKGEEKNLGSEYPFDADE